VAEYVPSRFGAYNVGSVEIEGAFVAEAVLVPEPAGGTMLGLATVLLLSRCYRRSTRDRSSGPGSISPRWECR
jgi:hypothetical protein